MTWFERMNSAAEYIESNLRGIIDFDVISKIMCQPAVSFQRTFSIVTGFSVFEYIRRRRMTLAAFELQNSSEKVIDIALEFGYESPEAFARAFKETHGVSPSSARKYSLPLKAFPRITFLLSIKGDTAMDYRIEKREAFSVYGIEGIFSTEDGKNLKDIPTFWMECLNNGDYDRLIKSTNEPLSRIHAVCGYRETGGNTFPYMLFVNHDENCDTKGFTVTEIPAATWAVFSSMEHPREKTSSVTQDLSRRVYTDWLPTAPFEKVDGYELELYHSSGLDNSYVEIWIRVEPK